MVVGGELVLVLLVAVAIGFGCGLRTAQAWREWRDERRAYDDWE